MDIKTRLLISLAASAAANCGPCFEHYHAKASQAGLDAEEIGQALELGEKIKGGASMSFKATVAQAMGAEQNGKEAGACCASGGSCC
jgi:AhpD family alkylhydroperoxidase